MQDAISKGATVAVGGKRPEYDASHPLSKGSFYEPTVLTGMLRGRLGGGCGGRAMVVAGVEATGARKLQGCGAAVPAKHALRKCAYPFDLSCAFLPSMAAPLPVTTAGATIDMRCFREEMFGPVTPVFKFSTDEEAIQMANTTEYGLAAYFYTKVACRGWDREVKGVERQGMGHAWQGSSRCCQGRHRPRPRRPPPARAVLAPTPTPHLPSAAGPGQGMEDG